MFKTFLPVMLIFVVLGLVWGGPVGVATAVSTLALFAVWVVRRWWYVVVPERETAVVSRTDGETFARFAGRGRFNVGV